MRDEVFLGVEQQKLLKCSTLKIFLSKNNLHFLISKTITFKVVFTNLQPL